jgi:hypothetical protein
MTCAQKVKVLAFVGPGRCGYNYSTCSNMCKRIFEKQHCDTIAFALKRIKIKEKASTEATAPALEKAIMVLSKHISDAL